jgi:hypothetical protein
MYITNNPDVALIAEKYGVDRIWVDLETLGKEDRQKYMNTVKSKHTVEDIKKIVPLLTTSEMLVRVNPWHEDSPREITDVIEAGADIIMLPMWKTVEEVTNFISAVDGRCKTILLLETKEAVECMEDVLKIKGIDEVHIGLNDLHLSYGLSFMYELLSNGMIEEICKKIKTAGIPYGFGGVARLGSGELLAEKIIREHYRIGSTRAILSRSFCNTEQITDIDEVEVIFRENITAMRQFEVLAEKMDEAAYAENHREVVQIVEQIVKAKRGI